MTRRGFTFIEVLVVMIVIGILATLAFARLQSSKEKGTIASMTSDLRAVAEEQEAYYFQNRVYAADPDSLNPNFSPGNLVQILEASSAGWSGQVSNPTTPKRCYIVVGNAAPVGSAANDGVINCS
jgi:prepilin-type N-terminal cleavage/methylation domain-containing protein